jgi:primosomal protein N' (replication factor Y) (superfamily II helicase)
MNTFVDVILPLPISTLFTYRLPDELIDTKVDIGWRVIVPFGQKKFYTGIVCHIYDTTLKDVSKIKEITAVLDKRPILYEKQLVFWEWLASYYLCTLGDIYKAALPSGLKIESKTLVSINPDYKQDNALTPKEERIWNSLSVNAQQTLSQIEKSTGEKNILFTIKSLIEKKTIIVHESLRQTYHPLRKAQIQLTKKYETAQAIHNLINELQHGRSSKRLSTLLRYLEIINYDETSPAITPVDKRTLLEEAHITNSILNELIRKQIFEVTYQEINRLQNSDQEEAMPNPLNEFQQEALQSIKNEFAHKKVCLLNGVTSSGKTEIYIHLISEAIRQGKQVLYLLPEIALTTQITERLKQIFGNKLGVYHSKFSDAERVEIWEKQLSSHPYSLILGVRSSVFLPFQKLGFIIVDEEHENTYKQFDPAPRYNARNCAIILGKMNNAYTLLGTATPSIESFYNAKQHKYGYVKLTKRYQEILLPKIIPVDMKELKHKKRNIGSFSPLLLEHISEALSQGKQIILFQNRRGYAPLIECKSCGWIPKCKNCDVSLTYHKSMNQLTCHYCGYVQPVPDICPECGSRDIAIRGFGTEKIEDEISTLFPEAKIARMDTDTTRSSRTAHEKIINSFQNKKTDIMIGTQMVSKGLDFDNVSVVGILDADSMLNFPDFRAHERAYQLMAQVAGRSGRKGKQGMVILQTRTPESRIIQQVINNDYLSMYEDQLTERQIFHYPPFYKIIYVYLKHHNTNLLDTASRLMGEILRQSFHKRVLGPDKPIVGRIQALFIKKIILKIEGDASLKQASEILVQAKMRVLTDKRFSAVQIYFDVDPM